MRDKNGQPIRTGDIVKITGAFCRQDNATYLVTHSEGDMDWPYEGLSLTRIRRDGVLSTAKNRTTSWPLPVRSRSLLKQIEAARWNAEHATIELQPMMKYRGGIIDYFRNEVVSAECVCAWMDREGVNDPHAKAVLASQEAILNRLMKGV